MGIIDGAYIRPVGGIPARHLDQASQDRLSSGEEVMDRLVASGSVAMSTGVLRLAFWTARKTLTVSQARVVTSSTAAAATPTLCRIGVYAVDGSGNLALAGACANDTTLFAATNTAYAKALTATYQQTAGTRYALGVLVVTAAAAPTLYSTPVMSGAELALAPRRSGSVFSQSDLPASITAGTVAASTSMIYGAVDL